MSEAPRAIVLADLATVPEKWHGAVLAIGNFDGVHRGHQAVLAAARAEADHRGVPCVMLTFEPHPRAFFSNRDIFRLTPAPLKAALAAALGCDGTLVLAFDRALAGMEAGDFVRDILVGRLGISAAVTGHDFHFGKARKGTPQFLARQGALNGFGVTIVEALEDAPREEGGEPISSTRIRAALSQGDVAAAATLLGWHWAAASAVIAGDRRGRELGYPTANMRLAAAVTLANGIYAVRFLGADGIVRDGVASYGRRPTFGGGEPLLETFVFDYGGDLYGQEAMVSLVSFIRPEARFDSAAALVAQMDIDAMDARARLQSHQATPLDSALETVWRER